MSSSRARRLPSVTILCSGARSRVVRDAGRRLSSKRPAWRYVLTNLSGCPSLCPGWPSGGESATVHRRHAPTTAAASQCTSIAVSSPASGSGGHADGSVGAGRVRRTSGSAGGRSLTLRIDRCPAEEPAWPDGSARLGRGASPRRQGQPAPRARGVRDRPRSSPPLAPCRCLGNLEMISGVGPAGGGQEAEKIA
jgi:hypothetical protein